MTNNNGTEAAEGDEGLQSNPGEMHSPPCHVLASGYSDTTSNNVVHAVHAAKGMGEWTGSMDSGFTANSDFLATTNSA